MKFLLFILVATIAVMSYFMYSMHESLEAKTLELNKEQRYSWEMIKGCEGHRMYLMNILDQHKIEYFN